MTVLYIVYEAKTACCKLLPDSIYNAMWKRIKLINRYRHVKHRCQRKHLLGQFEAVFRGDQLKCVSAAEAPCPHLSHTTGAFGSPKPTFALPSCLYRSLFSSLLHAWCAQCHGGCPSFQGEPLCTQYFPLCETISNRPCGKTECRAQMC